MARERKKPEGSFIERAKNEIDYTDTTLIRGAYELGKRRGRKEQKAIDKELIDMLIDELYTSRAYHLGITGLDSKEEIARKEIEGDCALIRGIDRTIKYVKEAMEE